MHRQRGARAAPAPRKVGNWRATRYAPGKEVLTPKGAQGVSVYYPFALVEFVEAAKTDEHEQTGEVLLHFVDSDGCQVTLRISELALLRLRERLNAWPSE